MSFVFMIFFGLLFFSGMVILLGSIAQYTSYFETEGEIIEELKCNPGDDDGELIVKKRRSREEAVVIAYSVGDKNYHLATNYKKPDKVKASPGSVRVLYNPYFPGDSRIKEGAPFLGSVLVVISLVGLVLMAFFF